MKKKKSACQENFSLLHFQEPMQLKPHTISEEKRMSSHMLKSKILAVNEDRGRQEFEP